jgi:hypothetical protein
LFSPKMDLKNNNKGYLDFEDLIKLRDISVFQFLPCITFFKKNSIYLSVYSSFRFDKESIDLKISLQ